MTMTSAQGTRMNSMCNSEQIDMTRLNDALPRSYAAIVNEHGVEVVITDDQICNALDALETEQLFPFGSQHTVSGLLVAKIAPARTLHS